MKQFLKVITKFDKYFLFLFLLVFFQSAGIYYGKVCRINNLGKKCQLIDKFKIVSPGNLFLRYYDDLRTYLLTNSSSGFIVKDLEDVNSRFSDLNSGFNFYYEPGSRERAGYILVSSADPFNDGKPLIQLWDLNNQKKIFSWKLNLKNIAKGIGYKGVNTKSLSAIHPLILDDGSLIINDILPGNDGQDPIIKVSIDGDFLKSNSEYVFHHSLERDYQDKIYVPIRSKKLVNGLYKDEGFAILDKNLNILNTYSLSKIFKDNGLNYEIYAKQPTKNPFHINDVAPLNNNVETRFVLLSLRSLSMIIAFDLETQKIVWLLKGFSSMQHDVDYLDEYGTQISFFDNNISMTPESFSLSHETKGNLFKIIKNLPRLDSSKKDGIRIYNYPEIMNNKNNLEFKLFKFNSMKEKFIPRTITSGQSEFISGNNSIFIEESNYGRMFEIEVDSKKILWQYLNKNDDSKVYMIHWSRRYEKINDNLIRNLVYYGK